VGTDNQVVNPLSDSCDVPLRLWAKVPDEGAVTSARAPARSIQCLAAARGRLASPPR